MTSVSLAHELEPTTSPEFVFGVSPKMLALTTLASQVAKTDIPVLVRGDSGTGKDACVRFMHRLSGLPVDSLQRIKCSTSEPRELLAILRNALQPLTPTETCGTLFLDGIDELDFNSQRALLSLLPDDEPKGADGKLRSRLISTTSQDLEKEIAAGRFRGELFYRINGVCLELPSLRNRAEDIPILMESLLQRYSRELQRPSPALESKSMDVLVSYAWPGNIRELGNVARKIVACGSIDLALKDLCHTPPARLVPGGKAAALSLKLASRSASKRVEREMILQSLERTHWNRKRAARELQISYKSLLYKIKQIQIQAPGSDKL
jgi:two-component system, NtrC family, response regulator AtoC